MSDYLYEVKSSLITAAEKPFLTAIKKSLPAGYFVQPQVNLASIIRKNGDHKYQNELYRNIDACVFDMKYKPIFLIEINDTTHNDKKRRERDEKIRLICEDAGIQLIRFWTSYGVNQEYISKRVNETLHNAPNYKRVAHFIEQEEVLNSPADQVLPDDNFEEIANRIEQPQQHHKKMSLLWLLICLGIGIWLLVILFFSLFRT